MEMTISIVIMSTTYAWDVPSRIQEVLHVANLIGFTFKETLYQQ